MTCCRRYEVTKQFHNNHCGGEMTDKRSLLIASLNIYEALVRDHAPRSAREKPRETILAMFDEMEREADEISSELCEPVKCEFCETWLPTHPLQNAKHLRQRIAELTEQVELLTYTKDQMKSERDAHRERDNGLRVQIKELEYEVERLRGKGKDGS